MDSKESCTVCFKIVCKRCGWEATDDDVVKIQKEEMTACPICGWRPEGSN